MEYFGKRIKNNVKIIKTLVEIGRIDEVEKVLKDIIETEKRLDKTHCEHDYKFISFKNYFNEWENCYECEKCEHVITTLEYDSLQPVKKEIRPKIVCLCGSTKFMDAFFEANWDFTLKGYIVLSVGVIKHAINFETLEQNVADRLDELHLRKIDLADEVYVLNVGGYIGKSTAKEVEYAKKIGKQINYLEAIK